MVSIVNKNIQSNNNNNNTGNITTVILILSVAFKIKKKIFKREQRSLIEY